MMIVPVTRALSPKQTVSILFLLKNPSRAKAIWIPKYIENIESETPSTFWVCQILINCGNIATTLTKPANQMIQFQQIFWANSSLVTSISLKTKLQGSNQKHFNQLLLYTHWVYLSSKISLFPKKRLYRAVLILSHRELCVDLFNKLNSDRNDNQECCTANSERSNAR